MANRVTLASLDQKLESFMELVKLHMEDDTKRFDRITASLEDNGKPGLRTRVALAEQELDEVKASKSRQEKAVWSTLVVVAGAILVKFIVG